MLCNFENPFDLTLEILFSREDLYLLLSKLLDTINLGLLSFLQGSQLNSEIKGLALLLFH